MVESLRKQEQWAAQHKKQYWWFTEERKVFREYVLCTKWATVRLPYHAAV